MIYKSDAWSYSSRLEVVKRAMKNFCAAHDTKGFIFCDTQTRMITADDPGPTFDENRPFLRTRLLGAIGSYGAWLEESNKNGNRNNLAKARSTAELIVAIILFDWPAMRAAKLADRSPFDIDLHFDLNQNDPVERRSDASS